MKIAGILLALTLIGLSFNAAAETEFFKEFKDNYGLLDQDLLKNPGEFASIKDFTYKKDVAEFTFENGTMHILRYVNDRPTTAIFIGKGRAHIEIPSHLEKNNLIWCSGDSVVNENFEVCFIRMADDFDLKLKEIFTFQEEQLDWKNFNIAKKAQGEFFFKPNQDHEYDNYFQLLRSVYERGEDGYFWIDFNRYVFNYDPNRPEQVVISYEHKGGDFMISEAAVFQRQPNGIYDDLQMSEINYPTTLLNHEGTIYMGGMDGRRVDSARINTRIQIDTDSLRFVTLFLHYNLKCDSIYYNNQKADFWRRKDFNFIGLLLPAYHYRGDTLNLTFWYNGKDYKTFLPFVEKPQATTHNLTFFIPNGYNYIMPGMSDYTKKSSNMQTFTVNPAQSFQSFYFQPYASGFDTIQVISDVGLTLNFLNSKEINKNRYPCFVPNNDFQNTTKAVFNYLSSNLGMPPGVFEIFVYPENDERFGLSMPGLLEVPQVFCGLEGTGGLHTEAGFQVARQWFGSMMQPVSYREKWLVDAVPAYLTFMYLQNAFKDGSIYYTELLHLKNRLLMDCSKGEDLPLAATRRLNEQLRLNKGAWIIHMLRYLMYDVDNHSDKTFWKFIREFSIICNNQTFSNKDFIQLAEKHYGQPLNWFFKKWLFDRNVPEYEVDYFIEKKADGYYINGTVKTKKMADDYNFPVIMRVENANKQVSFYRQTVPGSGGTFSLGPLTEEPLTLYFNEFYSMLSNDKVKKK